jgi:hypothetical protein
MTTYLSYLTIAIRSGTETPLTADCKAEVLKQTKALALDEALKTAKERR